jgi:predicted ferric reductase
VFYGIVAHVIFLVFGYQINGQPTAWSQFVQFLHYPDMMKALFGTIFFFALTGMSISFARKRVKHETWYWVHLTAYVAIYLTFFHQLSTGGDFIGHPLFRTYWTALYILAFALALVYRFANPLLQFWAHRLRIERIVQEAPTMFSLYITGRKLDQFASEAGQYFGVRVLNQQLWWQDHPFSLSAGPTDHELRLTFRVLGDYTEELRNVKPDTPVILDGPRGNFIWGQVSQSDVLMVAGGIGITPLLSMMQAAPENADIVLVYATRTQTETAFMTELAKLSRRPRMQVVYIFEDVQGRLTPELLAQNVPDFAAREAFICGPAGMMIALRHQLREAGVPEDLIHSERFSY